MTNRFTHKQLSSMQGTRALITGANTGLGFEMALQFAAQGAQVILACRSLDKANEAIQKIERRHPAADVTSLALDLSNLTSVRAAVEVLLEQSKLNLIVNNAGIMLPPYELTVDGFESQFGVNHLGPFAFTGLLLNAGALAANSRVVNTSSLASLSGKIFFDDINAEKGYKAMDRYCMSKLANLLYSTELDRRLKAADLDVISLACHPGIANTDLSRHLPSWASAATPLVSLLFNTPLQGAWSGMLASSDQSADGGEYYGPTGFRQFSGPAKQIRLPRIARNHALAQQLWQVSEQMTGVTYALNQA